MMVRVNLNLPLPSYRASTLSIGILSPLPQPYRTYVDVLGMYYVRPRPAGAPQAPPPQPLIITSDARICTCQSILQLCLHSRDETMLRLGSRHAGRAVAASPVAFQQQVFVPSSAVAANQALTARWMSSAAPGPKVCCSSSADLT